MPKHPNQLYVKNMVCQRCVMAVEGVLRQLDIPFRQVGIGEIHLEDVLETSLQKKLGESLEVIGLELIDDRKTTLIERIKQLAIAKARNEVSEADQAMKLSSYISSYLPVDYSHLSNLFSSVEGRTIESFFILQRIERVKELLVYDQLTLSEIAWQLGYSSTAHLSNQFKKVTGLTPSHFKEVGVARRKPLDTL